MGIWALMGIWAQINVLFVTSYVTLCLTPLSSSLCSVADWHSTGSLSGAWVVKAPLVQKYGLPSEPQVWEQLGGVLCVIIFMRM